MNINTQNTQHKSSDIPNESRLEMLSILHKPQHISGSILNNLSKKKITEEEAFQQIKEECHKNAKLLSEKLTEEEQCRVAFIPLIITNIAWRYCDLVLSEAAELRIDCLKKLTRSTKTLHQTYETDMMINLDYTRRRHIETETDKCLKLINLDMTKLFFSVNHEFKRTTPNYPYDRMRSHAVIGKLLIDYLLEYNSRSDDFIRERIGNPNWHSAKIPVVVDNLGTAFEAFAGVGEGFKWDSQIIQMAMKVIDNRIKQIEFSILTKEEKEHHEQLKQKAEQLKKEIEMEKKTKAKASAKEVKATSKTKSTSKAKAEKKVMLNIPCQTIFVDEMVKDGRREMSFDATPYWQKRILRTKAFTHVMFYSGTKRAEYKLTTAEVVDKKIVLKFSSL